MENQRDSGRGPNQLVSVPRSDSKMVGEKRVSTESGKERELGPRKRVKMRDLKSVCRSEGTNVHHATSLQNKESGDQIQFGDEEMSQVTEVPITCDFDASQVGKAGRNTFPVVVNPASRLLDLNTDTFIANSTVQNESQECSESLKKTTLLRDHDKEGHSKCVNARGIRLDLNAEDISSSENQDPFYPYKIHNYLKPGDASECGSSTGPLEEKDPMRLWKEMKQNGFLSSTHGGIPIPKQRVKKSKNEELKKKIERAKKEQVDRFTKIAAPSGLLNELNPGIINHVRNRKQVHSIIKALVRSEMLENDLVENKQTTHPKSGSVDIANRKDLESMNDSGIRLCHENWPPNTFSDGRQSRGYPILMNKSSLIQEDRGGDADPTTVERFSGKGCTPHSTLVSEEDMLALKLSSSTQGTENDSPLSEESASYLSIKAATIASQWLELIHQDIKGRLLALRRSRKRVRDVITTDLPALLSKEFSSDQENHPYIMKDSTDGISSCASADMHRARWTTLFDQMDKTLSEEENQLVSWLNQVKEMQFHCDQGLQLVNTASGTQQLGTSENDPSSQKMDNSEREIAVRAAAASIYSTCNFLLSTNVPCF